MLHETSKGTTGVRPIRRRRLLAGGATAGAGLGALFLAACSGETEQAQRESVSTAAPETAAQPGETPRRGGSLTFYSNEPVGFDPHMNDSKQTHDILSLFHAHLTRYSYGPDKEVNDYTPSPDLAESWEQADQTTYVFKLRPGIRWQAKPPVEGRELTADDVAYTFDRIKNLPATFAASQFFLLDRVEAVDGRTVRFSMREPFAPFMNYLSGNFTWIVPREAVEKFGDLKGIEGAVGAGPWMVESYNAGADITLVRNPNYYRSDAPYIDRMRALFGRGPAAVDAAFKAGETLIVGSLASSVAPVERFERLRKEVSGVLTFRWARPSGTHIMMRTDTPPLNDARVRRAMALAINQEEWIATVLSGYGYNQPCVFRGVNGSLPITDLGPGADAYKHDPQEARRLLEAAGHGSGLTLPFVVANRSAAHVEQGQLVQAYLADVGIDAKIELQEYASFIGGAYRGEYDAAGWDYYRLYSDGDQVYDMYHTKGDLNQNHVSDPHLDELIVKQRQTLDIPERRKVLAEIQRHSAGQYYDIFIPYNEQLSLWRPQVRGFRPSGWYDQGGVWLHCWIEEG